MDLSLLADSASPFHTFKQCTLSSCLFSTVTPPLLLSCASLIVAGSSFLEGGAGATESATPTPTPTLPAAVRPGGSLANSTESPGNTKLSAFALSAMGNHLRSTVSADALYLSRLLHKNTAGADCYTNSRTLQP